MGTKFSNTKFTLLNSDTAVVRRYYLPRSGRARSARVRMVKNLVTVDLVVGILLLNLATAVARRRNYRTPKFRLIQISESLQLYGDVDRTRYDSIDHKFIMQSAHRRYRRSARTRGI